MKVKIKTNNEETNKYEIEIVLKYHASFGWLYRVLITLYRELN